MISTPSRSLLPAKEYSGDLEGPLVLLAHALRRKGEAVPVGWVEDTVESLRSGRMLALISAVDGRVGGLLIHTTRRGRAFTHLFLTSVGDPELDALPLIRSLIATYSENLRRIDLTFSAVLARTEEEIRRQFPTWGLPFRFLERQRMSRTLDSATPPPQPPLPSGFRFGSATDFPVSLLAAVDFSAFEDSPDRGLVAESVEEDERILTDILAGELSPFLKDGSPSVIQVFDGGGESLLGFVLSVELTPGNALIVDVALLLESRGRGVGYALLSRALRGLLARGIREVALWVTLENVAAIHLYEKAGFRVIQKEPIYIWEASR